MNETKEQPEPQTVESAKPKPVNVCPHCGGDMSKNNITRRIRINRQWHDMQFCCQAAGGDYQMGCEG